MTAFHPEPGRGRFSGGRSYRNHEPDPRAEGTDRARRRALVLLPALVLIGGCGQKGALFLPEEHDEEARRRPAPVSVA